MFDADVAQLAGRVMVVLVLLQGGYLKLVYPGGTAQYLEQLGVPLAGVPLAAACGLLEMLCAIAIGVGWRTRVAAGVLIAYLIPMTWYTHLALAQGSPDQMVRDQETLQALKNLAVMGGLLLVGAAGPGRHAVDGR